MKKLRCEKMIYKDWSSYRCPKAGKYKEGNAYWCGIHLPSRVEAKRKARHDKWTEQWDSESEVHRKREGWIDIGPELLKSLKEIMKNYVMANREEQVQQLIRRAEKFL